jgi:hypothetical protein
MKTLNKTEFQALKKFISENEIDPIFLNYGNFVNEIKAENYKKEYREKITPFIGMYKIFTDSNLYLFDKVNGGNLILTEEQKNEILPIIEERKKTPYFIDYFNTKFNCFGFEYTVYSDDFETLKIFSNNWYTTNKSIEKLSLNTTEEQEKKLFEETKSKCLKFIETLKSKGINVLSFEIRKYYDLVNFTKEEFNYIEKNIIPGYKGINEKSHPTHQITRRTKEDIKHRIKDFKSYVLEPTKREILLDVHEYGITYVPIQEIKNF